MAAVPSIGRASFVEARHVAPEAVATKGLYERHATKIQGYCMHQLGSREEAEDAVQTTFMNAFRALGRGVVPEAESAWLFKIAENVCLSRRRSSWRRGRIESPSDFGVIEEIVPGPRRQRDELIGIEDALASMPEQQRRAILLREWQGLSYREVATELEVSQSAVETLIFRARRSLAQGLEQPDSIKPAKRKSFRRALHTLDLGTLLAAAKTLLTGGAAVKATAAAVAVTAVAGGTAATVVPNPQLQPSVAAKAAAAAPAARTATDASIISSPARFVSPPRDGTKAAAARRAAIALPLPSGRKPTRTAVRRSDRVRTAPAAAAPGAAPATSVAETPVAEPVEPVQAEQSNAEPTPGPFAERPQHQDRTPESTPAEAAGPMDDGKQRTESRAKDSTDPPASAQQPVAPTPEESKRWTGKGRHDERHVPPVVVLTASSSIAAPVPAPEPELEEAKGEGEDKKQRSKGNGRRDPVMPPAVGHPEPTPVVGQPTPMPMPPTVVDRAAAPATAEPAAERRFGEGDRGREEGRDRSDRSAPRRGK